MNLIKPVIVLLMIAILASCTTNSLEKTYEISSTPKTTESDLDTSSADISSTDVSIVNIPTVNNDLPLEKLNAKTVDIHYIVEKYFAENLTGQFIPFKDIVNDIGVGCFRQNEGGTYYSVNNVEQGGLLYIFYTGFPENEQSSNVIQWFYVQKNLSLKSFESIEKGDIINDVKQIDPVTQIFINIYNSNPEYWDSTGGFGSYYYLSDGILYINYKNENGQLVIIERIFVENFELTYITGMAYTYDGSILPIDRIK